MMKNVLNKIFRPAAGSILTACNQISAGIPTLNGFVNAPRHMQGSELLDLALGQYERPAQCLLKIRFAAANTIVEIGSGIGVASMQALKTGLLPGGRMICIDPDARSQISFMANFIRACERGEVRNDTTLLTLPYIITGDERLNGQQLPFIKRGQLSSAPAMMLSQILENTKVDGKYSLICNAEGAETSFIYGDSAALQNCDQILIKLHETSVAEKPVSINAMLARLRDLGFSPIARRGDTYYLDRIPQ